MFWLPAVFLAAGVFVSLHLETYCRPSAAGIRRPLPSFGIHTGLLLIAWALALAVCRRPIFALLAVLAGQILLIQVSNAKYRALREPFIFSDFGIFSQALKHPRLYFPFLGIGRTIVIAAAIGATVAVGWWLEPALGDFHAWAILSATAGGLLMMAGSVLAPAPLLQPAKDISEQGFVTSIAQYWLQEQLRRPARSTTLPSLKKGSPELPDIVVIQSESFFDARGLFPGIRREILSNYDVACAHAACSGQLAVPAWGANTMRPEFAFLTGLPPDQLGIHRFNPYRRVARRPLRALATVLREAGYNTTCLHPHPARFFRRDRAFPNLGFERFIDIRQFSGAKKAGPYISDEAVTDKLIDELQAVTQPSFFFVITMENHGPLHLEKANPQDSADLYSEAPPADCEDLTIYLRHLRNADEQLGRLRSEVKQRSRPTIFCFYGEHLPSMPAVYSTLGIPDGRTNYFVELPLPAEGLRKDMRVEDLPGLILGAVVCK